MNTRTSLSGLRLAVIALVAVFAAAGSASAHGGGGGGHGGGGGGGHGGGGGGGHGGGGMHAGGGHFGGGHGHGGGYGYRGGRYGGYGYGGYGWGGYGWGALGYGLFLSTLPYDYSTYWLNGSPYYYADNTYYQWNGSMGEYESVQPPQQLVDQAATQSPVVTKLFAYPMKGQTDQQQSRDKSECHHWASGQSGFDPTTPSSVPANAAGQALATMRSDYLRADTACLEARGYSVK